MRGKVARALSATRVNKSSFLSFATDDLFFITPFIFATSLVVGVVFYSFANDWPWSLSYYFAASVLFGDMFLIPTETNPYSSTFTLFYFLWGTTLLASVIAAAVNMLVSSAYRIAAEERKKVFAALHTDSTMPSEQDEITSEDENSVVGTLGKFLNLWCGQQYPTKYLFLVIAFLWVSLGIIWGIFYEEWTFGHSLLFTISAMSTAGNMPPTCLPSEDLEGCRLGVERAVFLGTYVIVGVPLFGYTISLYIESIIEKAIQAQERLLLSRPLSKEEFQFACSLQKGSLCNNDNGNNDGKDDAAANDAQGPQKAQAAIHLDFSDFIILELLRVEKITMEDLETMKRFFDLFQENQQQQDGEQEEQEVQEGGWDIKRREEDTISEQRQQQQQPSTSIATELSDNNKKPSSPSRQNMLDTFGSNSRGGEEEERLLPILIPSTLRHHLPLPIVTAATANTDYGSLSSSHLTPPLLTTGNSIGARGSGEGGGSSGSMTSLPSINEEGDEKGEPPSLIQQLQQQQQEARAASSSSSSTILVRQPSSSSSSSSSLISPRMTTADMNRSILHFKVSPRSSIHNHHAARPSPFTRQTSIRAPSSSPSPSSALPELQQQQQSGLAGGGEGDGMVEDHDLYNQLILPRIHRITGLQQPMMMIQQTAASSSSSGKVSTTTTATTEDEEQLSSSSNQPLLPSNGTATAAGGGGSRSRWRSFTTTSAASSATSSSVIPSQSPRPWQWQLRSSLQPILAMQQLKQKKRRGTISGSTPSPHPPLPASTAATATYGGRRPSIVLRSVSSIRRVDQPPLADDDGGNIKEEESMHLLSSASQIEEGDDKVS